MSMLRVGLGLINFCLFFRWFGAYPRQVPGFHIPPLSAESTCPSWRATLGPASNWRPESSTTLLHCLTPLVS